MFIKIILIALLAELVAVPAFAQAQTKPFVKEQKPLQFHPPFLCREACDFRQNQSHLEIYQASLFSTEPSWTALSDTNFLGFSKREVSRE